MASKQLPRPGTPAYRAVLERMKDADERATGTRPELYLDIDGDDWLRRAARRSDAPT